MLKAKFNILGMLAVGFAATLLFLGVATSSFISSASAEQPTGNLSKANTTDSDSGCSPTPVVLVKPC